MRVLDRSRPFGELLGEGASGYVQDGVLFDRQGNEQASAQPLVGTAADGGSATLATDAPERPAALPPGFSSSAVESGGRRRRKGNDDA